MTYYGQEQEQLILYQQMGIQSENYHYVFKTATVSRNQTLIMFEKDFLSSVDAGCNLFVSNIFNVDALKSQKIDLDQCFVPSYETFTAKQLPFLCPMINRELLEGNEIDGKVAKLKFIIEYCIYLGLKRVAIEFNPLKSKQILTTLKQIEKYFKKGKLTLITIIDIGAPTEKEQQQIWRYFISFRNGLRAETNIELSVEIGPNLPQKRIIKKWMGEHVVFLSISQQAFVLNNKGYPVLSASHEQVVKEFLRRHVNLALHHQVLSTIQQKQPYFKYFAFVLEKLVKSLSKWDMKAQTLLDYLQAPLQPYIDNLDAQVYDIFQFDSVKYHQYQVALSSALQSFKGDKVIVCYYVGSGKGLILAKLMSAAKSTGRKIKVYCLDKNPYPLQTLRRRIHKNKWSKIVQVIQTDIKDYVMPEHPDIIFSELLGGLGDNQLSPECVQWAEKNATSDTRIIPQKYTSFIRPISCHILHKQLSKQEKQSYFTVNFGLAYTPFASKIIWSFQHPLTKEDDLTREAKLEWKVEEEMVLHGFQGTFDCNLFDKAYFSIVGETKNKDFYSWFPIFFSFREEEVVLAGEQVIVCMQRRCTANKVWYQWCYQLKNNQGVIRKKSQWHNQTADTAILLKEEP